MLRSLSKIVKDCFSFLPDNIVLLLLLGLMSVSVVSNTNNNQNQETQTRVDQNIGLSIRPSRILF